MIVFSKLHYLLIDYFQLIIIERMIKIDKLTEIH